MKQGKTPDFRVFKGDEVVLYCESKPLGEQTKSNERDLR